MKNLGQYRDCRQKRLADGSQSCFAAIVKSVFGVKESHERPRIDQNHRLSFLRSASWTPLRLSVEGAIE